MASTAPVPPRGATLPPATSLDTSSIAVQSHVTARVEDPTQTTGSSPISDWNAAAGE